jgi:hypothetical protein
MAGTIGLLVAVFPRGTNWTPPPNIPIKKNYSNAIYIKVGVVCEKLPCRFYTLGRELKQRKPSRISKYIFEGEMKVSLFYTCSFLKGNFIYT